MTKVLNAITLNTPAANVAGPIGATFAFAGTPGFTGTSSVQGYDAKWEADPGSGYVTLDNTTTGLRTSATNPIVNRTATTQMSATVTLTTAGTYTIRMSGAPTSGGSYTVTSATKTVTVNSAIQPAAVAMTFTGATPTVAVTNNISVTPTVMALTFTGATPTVAVTTNVSVAPTVLAMTWAGATPSVMTPVTVAPAGLSLSLTGATPIVASPVRVSPDPLAMNLTGATPTVSTPISVNPSALALALAFATPAVSTPVGVVPSAASLALTFATPTVTVSGGSDIVVTPDALAMLFAGAVPYVGLNEARSVVAGGFGGMWSQMSGGSTRDQQAEARAALLAVMNEEDALDILEVI